MAENVRQAASPCCLARRELDDARREIKTWWADLDFEMPVYDLVRQAREREAVRWQVLEPVAEELRALAESVRESHLAPMLRKLADKLDPRAG